MYLLKLSFGNLPNLFISLRSDRNGNKQKNSQANNEATCRCDMVTD
jgi:hypothetical protein